MTKPTGIDESWSRADWDELQRRGITVVSLYLSRDPTKNAKPGDIRAAHRRNISILLNWEGFAGAPLNGRTQGVADAKEWVAQRDALIKAVGYAPKNKLGAIFSCDRDVTHDQIVGPVAAYYGATLKVVRAANALNGVYGEYDLIEWLHKYGFTQVEWQTYAWSQGKLSPEADFYQYLNGQKIGSASVDFDRVVHAAQLGAWWPPGHRYDTATPTGNGVLDMDEKALLAALTKWAKSKDGAQAISDALLGRQVTAKGPDGKVRTHPVSTWLSWGGIHTITTRSNTALLLSKLDKALTVAFDPKAAATQLLAYVRSGIQDPK